MRNSMRFGPLIVATRFTGIGPNHESIREIRKSMPTVQAKTMYGYGMPITVFIFETTEDVIIYKLKYGDTYA